MREQVLFGEWVLAGNSVKIFWKVLPSQNGGRRRRDVRIFFHRQTQKNSASLKEERRNYGKVRVVQVGVFSQHIFPPFSLSYVLTLYKMF